MFVGVTRRRPFALMQMSQSQRSAISLVSARSEGGARSDMCTTASNRGKRNVGYRLYGGEQGRYCPAAGRAAWQRSRDCRGVVAWDTPNSAAQLGCGTHLTLTSQTKFPTTGLATQVFVMSHLTGRSEAHACPIDYICNERLRGHVVLPSNIA
jgi:hypothetical protein